MVAELLKKYLWLLDLIIRSGDNGISFNEINQKYSYKWGEDEYKRRTFIAHKEAIAEIFDIEIQCNRSTNKYYIESNNSTSSDKSSTDSSAWLLRTFSVNSLINEGKRKLSGRISLEDVPSDHKFLTSIMQAMLDKQEILIKYQKYIQDNPETHLIKPYAVKEYKNRWYLIAYCYDRDGIRNYSLDRIKELEIQDSTFQMPNDFNLEELFATSSGIYIPSKESGEFAFTIRFKAYKHEVKYLRDLPLHPSQIEVETGEDYSIFELFLYPDVGFIMEILKFNSGIEILEPQHFREKIKDEIIKMMSIYE